MGMPELSRAVEIVVGGEKHNLGIKEYQQQRVVTLKEIDNIHNRVEGTARRNFFNNKNHFIEGEDYFAVTRDDIKVYEIFHPLDPRINELILITKTGYLMLVKSFNDDLAWQIQRELVNKYFYPEIKYSDEYLHLANNLYNSPNLLSLGKGAQKEIGKAIANAIKLSGRESKKQKSITALAITTPKTEPNTSDLLNELLSHAVPLMTFIPRSLTELKSSVLYDEKFYYIFPFSIERYLGHVMGAKKHVYKELRFLDGKYKNKHFNFWNTNGRKVFHIWILHREAVMLSPLLCRSGDCVGDSSAQVGGDTEK